MGRRITERNVRIVRQERLDNGGWIIEAHVRGLRSLFVVDLNLGWSKAWMCSCGKAPTCAHVCAVREVLEL